MDNDWEKVATLVTGSIATVGGFLGTWYLRIKGRLAKIEEEKVKRERAEAEATAAREQQKLTAQRAETKQERNDVNEEAWVLIRRLQEIIKDHSEELSKLKDEYETCLTKCENRERELMTYCAKLEKQYGRTIERIRFYESQL